jgi:hypothetical protein
VTIKIKHYNHGNVLLISSHQWEKKLKSHIYGCSNLKHVDLFLHFFQVGSGHGLEGHKPHPWSMFFLSVRDQVSHPYKTTHKIMVLYILIFKFLDGRL